MVAEMWARGLVSREDNDKKKSINMHNDMLPQGPFESPAVFLH